MLIFKKNLDLSNFTIFKKFAGMSELAYEDDLKSSAQKAWGFESLSRHNKNEYPQVVGRSFYLSHRLAGVIFSCGTRTMWEDAVRPNPY